MYWPQTLCPVHLLACAAQLATTTSDLEALQATHEETSTALEKLRHEHGLHVAAAEAAAAAAAQLRAEYDELKIEHESTVRNAEQRFHDCSLCCVENILGLYVVVWSICPYSSLRTRDPKKGCRTIWDVVLNQLRVAPLTSSHHDSARLVLRGRLLSWRV